MVTDQAQIKLTLPVQLLDFLESKARKFGLPVAAYLRHLVIKDVEEMEYPVFEMSEMSLKKLKKAIKDEEEGKLVEVKGKIRDFFENLEL